MKESYDISGEYLFAFGIINVRFSKLLAQISKWAVGDIANI